MKKAALALIVLCAALFGLGSSVRIPVQESPLPASSTYQPLPSPPVTVGPTHKSSVQATATRTIQHFTPISSPTSDLISSPTLRAQLTPTRQWLYHSPGDLMVPILLYHHVAATDEPKRYTVSPENFEAQISSLHDWGYTAITISLLVDAVLNGADLPPRPVVITFDDGYRDIYKNALPVMQRYGYVGTLYIIVDQIGVGGYLNARQIADLIKQGWELGSHSQTHANLRRAGISQDKEISGSKDALEGLFSTPIRSFSYPYGSATLSITRLVKESGYQSGVGLGESITQRAKNLYYLSRKEVQGTFDLIAFAGLLR